MTPSPRAYALLLALLFPLALAACSDDEETEEPAGDDGPQTFQIKLDVVAGSQDVTCGATLTGIGTAQTDLVVQDMRMYVHDVRLVRADGTSEALALENDGIWQTDTVALLDFENGCLNGTTELNDTITGTAPAGEYTGVQFTVGVPPELNSPDTALEARSTPLNLTAMHWGWAAGYKFIRLDTDPDFRLHLGSTSCTDDFTCANVNQPTVTVNNVDLTKGIKMDIATLLGGVDVTTNTDETPPGCMSAPADPDCTTLFDALGLGSGEQTIFTPM